MEAEFFEDIFFVHFGVKASQFWNFIWETLQTPHHLSKELIGFWLEFTFNCCISIEFAKNKNSSHWKIYNFLIY